jgi:hypothetical protein
MWARENSSVAIFEGWTMSKDSQISLLSHMLRVSLDELVYSFVRGEIEKEEFLKQYEYNRQLERKYECCCEIGIDTLDWKELERRGQLCAVDYETFGLDKLGMSDKEGWRRYNEYLMSQVEEGLAKAKRLANES